MICRHCGARNQCYSEIDHAARHRAVLCRACGAIQGYFSFDGEEQFPASYARSKGYHNGPRR